MCELDTENNNNKIEINSNRVKGVQLVPALN